MQPSINSYHGFKKKIRLFHNHWRKHMNDQHTRQKRMQDLRQNYLNSRIIFKNSHWGFPGSKFIKASFSSFFSACCFLRSSRFFCIRSTSFTTLLRLRAVVKISYINGQEYLYNLIKFNPYNSLDTKNS